MGLLRLSVSNLRNIDQAALTPHPRFNLITGDNGSGKTSLLEAIYTLGRGRSFRTPNSDKLIQKGRDSFTVSGCVSSQGREFRLGIQRADRQTHIRLSGKNVRKASQLTEVLPIQVIETSLHAFFEQGPEVRRRFLEWGVFHVEPAYEQAWRNYKRTLQQRNAALKGGWQQTAIAQWDALLIESADKITGYRQSYVDRISTFIREFNHQHGIGFMDDLRVDYYPGWKKGETFRSVLAHSLATDRERGFTQSGPHRADIRVRLGVDVGKDILSRGQQKLFVSLLYLAQSILLRELTGKQPLILIDDLAAELDELSRQTLAKVLSSSKSQIFITATSLDSLGDICRELPHSLFHVEHGQVEQVI